MKPAEGNEPEGQPIEKWAEALGYLPEFKGNTSTGAAIPNPEYWKFAAAKAFRRWEDGQVVTEADFDAAVEKVQQHETR